MRLLYNYSRANYCAYSQEDEDKIIKEIVNKGDAYSVYDIEHWTGDDFLEFTKMENLDQLGILDNLKEI